jgi:hypothetical protein
MDGEKIGGRAWRSLCHLCSREEATMQRVFVDYGRGIGNEIPLLLTSSANATVHVTEGERVLLFDDSLEVEGVVHQGTNPLGIAYWYAIPDWATRHDIADNPAQTTSA